MISIMTRSSEIAVPYATHWHLEEAELHEKDEDEIYGMDDRRNESGRDDENEAEDQSDSDGVAESGLGEEDNTGASGKDEGNDSERSE